MAKFTPNNNWAGAEQSHPDFMNLFHGEMVRLGSHLPEPSRRAADRGLKGTQREGAGGKGFRAAL